MPDQTTDHLSAAVDARIEKRFGRAEYESWGLDKRAEIKGFVRAEVEQAFQILGDFFATYYEDKEREDAMSDYEKLVAEETLIVQATEAICERMEEDSETATRKALAKKLGRSKGFVSQVLSGDRNMTLRTLAQFATALGYTAEVKLTAIPAPPGEKPANNGTTLAVHSFPGIDGDWVAHVDSRSAIAAAEDKGRSEERERLTKALMSETAMTRAKGAILMLAQTVREPLPQTQALVAVQAALLASLDSDQEEG